MLHWPLLAGLCHLCFANNYFSYNISIDDFWDHLLIRDNFGLTLILENYINEQIESFFGSLNLNGFKKCTDPKNNTVKFIEEYKAHILETVKTYHYLFLLHSCNAVLIIYHLTT